MLTGDWYDRQVAFGLYGTNIKAYGCICLLFKMRLGPKVVALWLMNASKLTQIPVSDCQSKDRDETKSLPCSETGCLLAMS